METVELLGMRFDHLDVSGVIRELLEKKSGSGFSYLVTPNIDHLARLRRRPELRVIYDKARFRLLDSRLLANAAQALGLATPEVATGADITAQLLPVLPPQKIAVIGFEARHMPALQQSYPHLDFIHHAPPMNLLENRDAFLLACDFAIRARTRFTIIALGSPLQELLAYAIACHPDAAGTGLCVGAALEFCSGARRRAPFWVQRAGLEWLHRLLQNPRRLARRYLIDDPPVLLALAGEAFRQKALRYRRQQPLQGLAAAILAHDLYPPQPPARLQ